MGTAGIVCEYNPFHKGHEYQIQQARQIAGIDHIVCFMSGNFLQRGIPAITDKYTRTTMALSCGADAVFEIPFVYATSSAHDYATAAISMMNSMGDSIDYIVFGAETDNLQLLCYIADIITHEPAQLSALIKANTASGISYGAARAKAVSDYIYSNSSEFYCCESLQDIPKSDLDNILSSPNNILAIEYICALNRTQSRIKPILIPRTAPNYNSTSCDNDICSASAIREIISHNDISSLKRHIPSTAYDILTLSNNKTFPVFEDSLTTFLNAGRILIPKQSGIVDMDKDLANRFYKLKINMTYAETVAALKCRNYTLTHIQRALLHQIFSLSKDEYQNFKNNGWISYIKLLGIKKESSSIIAHIKEVSSVPIITKSTEIYSCKAPVISQMFSYDIKASLIYSNIVYSLYGYDLKNDFIQSIIVL